MRGTERLAGRARRAAKEEIRMARIADRPAAGGTIQLCECAALQAGNVDVAAGVVHVGPRLEHPTRHRARPPQRDRRGCKPARYRRGHNSARRLGARTLCLACRALNGAWLDNGRRQIGDSQAANFPQHRRARNAVLELSRDRPRVQPFRPVRLERVDTRGRPRRPARRLMRTFCSHSLLRLDYITTYRARNVN